MRLRAKVAIGTVTAGLTLAGAVLAGGVANAGSTPAAAKPPTKADIIATTKLVGDYWAAHGTNLAALNWENATFHVGNLNAVIAGGVTNHVTRPWAIANKYALPNDGGSPFFPDNLAPGEVYLDLLHFHPDTPLTAVRQRVADETKSVMAGHVDYVNYVDGLNMALPSFARLGVLDKNDSELAAMQALFTYAEQKAGGKGLFDEATGLWWRDKKYVGSNTYWSRGNGWAMIAMAKVAGALPASNPLRQEYIRVLKAMAARLKTLQRSDGFWNVDLTNPKNFGGPETSGTAFFTYAIAWGVANGVLPTAEYKPVAEKAWAGMVKKAVGKDGHLGYVQGEGQKPGDSQPVTAKSTAAYGVGGFLLAGAELSSIES